MINFEWYKFEELTVEQLYAVLAIRAEVFVVDQHCPYLDPDGKDRYALHLLGQEGGSLAAYMRLFLPTEIENYLIFGRVVTAKSVRGQGCGKRLIEELLTYCDAHFRGVIIKCSAQYYLQKFYEGFGFTAHGEVYQEDSIPHIAMQRVLTAD